MAFWSNRVLGRVESEEARASIWAKTLRVEVKRWRNPHPPHEASHTSLDNEHVLQAGNGCTWGRP